jgi:hypothetical protein
MLQYKEIYLLEMERCATAAYVMNYYVVFCGGPGDAVD